MDAQKFGHTVGQFFKKIDRTLSFLPGKPRKAVVTAAALAASPILAGVIISKTKPSKNIEYLDEEPVSDTSLLSELLAMMIHQKKESGIMVFRGLAIILTE